MQMGLAELRYVFFHSFGHSQGRLILQIDILSYIASHWRETGIVLDEKIKGQATEQLVMLTPPPGHRAVDMGETKAQFQFWWETMWDIFWFHGVKGLASGPAEISGLDLQNRSLKFSGPEAYAQNIYSSLRADKMPKLAERILLNDPRHGSHFLLRDILLPNIISVETYFQGEPRYTETIGRQRTDNSDSLESWFCSHCHTAIIKKKRAESLNIFDELYLESIEYIQYLELHEPTNEFYQDYIKLINLYNQNHPQQPRKNLHQFADVGA